MNIILATRNPSKAAQIKPIFIGMPVSILTLDEAHISGAPDEDGETLRENALIKARYAFEHAPSGYWTMADDTGLFIDALNGEPGIKSARWLGKGVPVEETMAYCLKCLKEVRDPHRSAYFETAVALISPDKQEYFFKGRVLGRILESPRCPPQPNMPYSSIFQPHSSNRTWAEMPIEEENAISHRGMAFLQVRKFLEELI